MKEKNIETVIADMICDLSQLVTDTIDVDFVLASKYRKIVKKLVNLQKIIERSYEN